jgi:hypothetical protein
LACGVKVTWPDELLRVKFQLCDIVAAFVLSTTVHDCIDVVPVFLTMTFAQ